MSSVVPDGWSLKPVGEMISESRIALAQDNPSKRLAVRLNLNGIGKRTERATDQVGATKYFSRRAGQFVYGKQNLHKGAFGIIPYSFDGFSSSQDIPTFDFNVDVHPYWFNQYFQQKDFYEGLEKIASGTGSKRIQPKDLYLEVLLTPPLPEQKKIASILTSVDEVIENTQKQIDKLQDLKKATMNELLTKGIGHTEFKDSELGRIPKSWEVKSVGELYEDTKYLTSDSNEMPLFSLTMEHGLVSKPDRYIRDFLITDTSKDNYKSVRKGELVMNPMNLRWGAISAHYERFDVCVSKYYNVLRGRDDQTSTLFYEALFQSKRFLNLYEKIAIGTLEEKKRVHWSDFQNIKVPVPPMQEQQRMETVIEHFLANISRVMDRNSKYKSLKKSLMQDLLTGKVRVTVN